MDTYTLCEESEEGAPWKSEKPESGLSSRLGL